jgi:hypothetical protein
VSRAVGCCWAADGGDAAADGDGGGRGPGRRDVRGHRHRAVQRAGVDAPGREAGVRRGRPSGAPHRRGGPRRRVRRHGGAAPAGHSLLRAHGNLAIYMHSYLGRHKHFYSTLVYFALTGD